MTSEAPERAVAPSWTPRQRQVLDLLVRGYTNGQIGETLGISLDGAKWHVSEVMGKLGVDSREAAAAYWRAYNRPAARFSRAMRGLLLGSGPRWAAGVAVAVGAGLVLVVVAFSIGGDDDSPATVPEETPTAGSTPDATPTPGATATPLQGSGIIGEKDGLPIFELVPADPVSLPEGSVLYYSEMCGVCIHLTLYRLSENETSGEWKRETVLAEMHPGLPPGYPLVDVISDRGERFAVLWCLEDPARCGKRLDGSPRGPLGLVLSEDGGATWQMVGELPPDAFLHGFAADGIVFSVHDDDPANQAAGSRLYRVYPSGRSVPTEEGEALAIRAFDGWNVRVESDGGQLTNVPARLFTLWPNGSNPTEHHSFPGGGLWLQFAIGPQIFLGEAQRGEKAFLPGRLLLPFDLNVVVVDFAARTLSPLAGLTRDNEYDFLRPVALVLPASGSGGQ